MESDPLLATLIKVANNVKAPLPITLMVGGTVVSGEVIPLQQYLDRVSRALGGVFDGVEMPPYESAKDVTHLHLQNVTVFAGEGKPIRFPQLWRCRLADVSAFSLLRAELKR